jgi:hypothetical protein
MKKEKFEEKCWAAINGMAALCFLSLFIIVAMGGC